MNSDERLCRMEAWLSNLYKDAEEEMRGKWDAYMARQEKRSEKLLKAVSDAKTPEEKQAAEAKYQAHLKAVTSGSEYYRGMVKELARGFSEANVRALEYINGRRAEFFADGYNFTAGEVNEAAVSQDISIRFNLVDADTVEWLAERSTDYPDAVIMPPPDKLKIPEDERWNARLINAQVAQGIVQGESIPKIARRLTNVTDSDYKACVRRARTMATNCENAGRTQGMQTAEGWGVQTRKQWVSTHDSRTRHTHDNPPPNGVSGETVANDAFFSNGCRWPGDHLGPPAEVWNCRCTLVTVVDGFSSTLPKGKEGAIRVSFGDEFPAPSAPAAPAGEYPTIDGVKRGNPMTHEEADTGRVNPNFLHSRGFQINCQSCVVTYEARRRGYDVQVVANNSTHPMCETLSHDARLAWKNADGSRAEFLPGFGDGHWHYSGTWADGERPTAKRMEKKLLEAIEEGGRYEMGFPWKGRSGGGHIVTVRKENEELVMYDPQSDRTVRGKDFAEYLQDIKYEMTYNGAKYYSYPRILRVDDKELDFDVANQIMREA